MLPLSVHDWVDRARKSLEEAGLCFGHGTDNALDEAAALVLQALGLPPDPSDTDLTRRVGPDEDALLRRRLEQRIQRRVPAAYLSGEAWFAGLPFYVDQRTLVPRSPIAELIEERFSPWVDERSVKRVLDLCTGGGCIGIAVALAFPDASVDLTDLSLDALAVAGENVRRHGVEDRVEVLHSDLYAALAGRRYDLIVCNPPYVSRAEMETLPAEFRHEPELGLAGGEDGLDLVLPVLAGAAMQLSESGVLVVEVGNGQEALNAALPDIPFLWLEFRRGGHGVFLLHRQELIDHADALRELTEARRDRNGR